MVEKESLVEAAFEEAKKEIESDLIFSGHENAIEFLRRLHYSLDTSELNLQIPEEHEIYRLNYSRLQSLNGEMKRTFRNLKDLLSLYKGNQDQALEQDDPIGDSYFCLQAQKKAFPRELYTFPQRSPLFCEPLL
jgi:hypothetical protein